MPKLLNKLNLPRYSSAPASPAEADLYYNTSDDKIYVYTGAAWVEVGSGAGGSGVYYQSSAPVSPNDGDIWIDSDDEVASVTSITDSTSTTSSTVAASATAVKSAYDAAVSKVSSVTGTSPISSSGGTTPAISIASASTSAVGAVQLEDSTSSTSTTKAATPNSVKSAYDLANGAIQKTLTTTKGDIIYASAANTPARLAINTANTPRVLTVNRSTEVPYWERQDGSLLHEEILASAAQNIAITGIPQSWKNLRVVLRNAKPSDGQDQFIQVYFNGSYNDFIMQTLTLDTSGYYPWYGSGFYLSPGIQSLKDNTWNNPTHYEINIFNYSSTTVTKSGHYLGSGQSASGRVQWSSGAFHWNNTAAITEIGVATSVSFAAGSALEIYCEGIKTNV